MKHKIEYISTDKLIPYARNSRTHSDEQVAQISSSINEFGFTNPVLIDADDCIIAGHGRTLAAHRLQMKEVPCLRLSYLTDAQKQAYVIADNKLALNAGWDDEMLKIELKELKDADFDLSLTGFADNELADLLADAVDDGLVDDDAVPEVLEKPVSVLGDVWKLDQHRVMCGDSTSITAIDELMEMQKADMWLTDPPYNIAYKGGSKIRDAIKNDKMEDSNFRQFLSDAYTAADLSMKQGAVFYIWHADSEGYNFRGACLDVGWKIRQTLIWNKNNSAFGRSDYHWKHEPCLYGWKDGAGHFWANDRKQTTVLDFDRPSKSEEHPTMKPVGLIEYQIKNNTRGSDLILDSFGGSGSTLIACEKTGRKARLMELDPKYVDVIIKRWQDYTGRQAIHVESGKTFDEMVNGSANLSA